MRNKKWAIGLAILAVVIVVFTGCSEFKDDRGIGDAPASQVEDRPVYVWPVPDQFMNIGAFCIGPNGVYIHTREAAPVVVAADPNCAPDGILQTDDPLTYEEAEEG